MLLSDFHSCLSTISEYEYKIEIILYCADCHTFEKVHIPLNSEALCSSSVPPPLWVKLMLVSPTFDKLNSFSKEQNWAVCRWRENSQLVGLQAWHWKI